MGSDAFVSDFVEKKLMGRLESTVRKLMDFEDSQAALFLLRVSFSIVRGSFHEATPLQQWRQQALNFDALLRTAAESILGFPMSDHTYAQASLTPTLGGLGLRKTVEHARLAYSASWHESMDTAEEDWIRPSFVSPTHQDQKSASFEFDRAMLEHLVASAPNDREVQRLRRLAQPHAGAFVTAVPSEEDGFQTIMRPRNFRVAVRYRLGVVVLKEDIPCPMCQQTLDKLGDHATCCPKSGDIIVRHNSLRNLVNQVAADGLLNPVMEKKGILGPTSGRRPGDVTIPCWAYGKGLAIDLAVTSPFTDQHLRLVEPCEHYAYHSKHGKYDRDFRGTDFMFGALVFETTGAITEEGTRILRQLFRFAAKRLGHQFSSYCGRAWARFSCNLQKSVSQAILSRCDGLGVCPAPSTLGPTLGSLDLAADSKSVPPPAIPPFTASVSSAVLSCVHACVDTPTLVAPLPLHTNQHTIYSNKELHTNQHTIYIPKDLHTTTVTQHSTHPTQHSTHPTQLTTHTLAPIASQALV